jgi:hypothetical protein
MYLGKTVRGVVFNGTRYVPGLGDLPTRTIGAATVHRYRCDHCGRLFDFAEPATEPFYCHSHECRAVKLVSITPAGGSDES